MVKPAYSYLKGVHINGCELIMLPAGKDWFWHCRTHDTQGEPADIITAYWGGLVHEKERENND